MSASGISPVCPTGSMPTSRSRTTVAAKREAASQAVTSGAREGPDGPDGLDAFVRRAQAGDVGAYEAIYRAHVGRVHALCRRMAGDPDRAAELTQEVFVHAWEQLGHFRGGVVLATWLHRLTLSLTLEQAPAVTAALSPRERSDFERAIDALAPAARTTFVLHDVEGYKHAEIAHLTGADEGTIRAQLHRARRRLMEMLSG